MKRALLAVVALAAVIVFYKLSINVMAGGAEYSWVVDPLNYDSRESYSVGQAGLTYTTTASGSYYNPQLACVNFLLHREVANVTFTITATSNQTGTLKLFGTLGGAGTDKYVSQATLATNTFYKSHYLIFYDPNGNILDYFNIALTRTIGSACGGGGSSGYNYYNFYVYRVNPVTLSETQLTCQYAYTSSSTDPALDKWVSFNILSSNSVTITVGPTATTTSLTASMVQTGDMYKIAPIQYRICLGVDWVPNALPASLTLNINVQYSFK